MATLLTLPKRTVKKIALWSGVNRILAQRAGRPLILGFHRIKQGNAGRLDQSVGVTSPQVLEEIIDYLTSLGYQFASLNALVDAAASPHPVRLAALTFDDGFADLYHNAFPILRKHGIPFTLFLISSTVSSPRLIWLHKIYKALEMAPTRDWDRMIRRVVGIDQANVPCDYVEKAFAQGTKESLQRLADAMGKEAGLSAEEEKKVASELYLDDAQLQEMVNHGLSVEPHGHEHWSLSILDERQTRDEVKASTEAIELRFKKRPQFYCLPFGKRNAFLKEIAESLGMKGVLAVDPALMTSCPQFFLPRLVVHCEEITSFAWQLTAMLAKTSLSAGRGASKSTV